MTMTHLTQKFHSLKVHTQWKDFDISYYQFMNPLKFKKVNISSMENPKFSNIGDYWDDKTVGKITDLFHAFQDMFP